VTFNYDENGNTTNENRGGIVTQYSYDQENRIRARINPDGTRETMTFDGDGLRRLRQRASGVTTYIWDRSDYLGEMS